MDIYLLNGAYHEGKKPEETPTNRLYRNIGDCRFTDVTDSAGVGDASEHEAGAHETKSTSALRREREELDRLIGERESEEETATPVGGTWR